MSGPVPRAVQSRLTGPFDAAARRRLDRAVAGWAMSAGRPGVAHIDLTGATGLDADGTAFLAAVHRRLAAAGWQFRITPPDDAEARTVFIQAVIQGTFGWAAPVCRRGDDETA